MLFYGLVEPAKRHRISIIGKASQKAGDPPCQLLADGRIKPVSINGQDLASRSQDAHPLGQSPCRIGQRPEEMPAYHQIEGGGLNGQRLCISLTEIQDPIFDGMKPL